MENCSLSYVLRKLSIFIGCILFVACGTMNRVARVDERLLDIYNRYPEAVSKETYTAGSDPGYLLKFSDSSYLNFGRVVNQMYDSCHLGLPIDFPRGYSHHTMMKSIYYRARPVEENGKFYYQYMSSLFFFSVGNCAANYNCQAAKHAEEEVIRLLTSDLFRTCCKGMGK